MYAMDQNHYREMRENVDRLSADGAFINKEIYIFGHCSASEELAVLLIEKGYRVTAFLDNNRAKQGGEPQDIPIISPLEITQRDMARMFICIVSRAYESMARQLRKLGYSGRVEKLADYNTFAEYSLSQETIARKRERVRRGIQILERVRNTYPHCFLIICPFSALGDVYYTMAYLPYFLKKRKIDSYTVVAVGRACAEVVRMFGCGDPAVLDQKEMDELVQAVLFTGAQDAFISHHDRPYTNLLMKALYVKFIPFEQIYRCGVFDLEQDCRPYMPSVRRTFSGKNRIRRRRSVILAPYAKSVAGIRGEVWEKMISYYREKQYQVYTNIVGEEKALPGTEPFTAELAEFQSAVEQAGTFIGIRSGLCDVIRGASCRKIVLFPDCYYSDTKWKVADFFHLDGWENVEVKNGAESSCSVHIGKDLDL